MSLNLYVEKWWPRVSAVLMVLLGLGVCHAYGGAVADNGDYYSLLLGSVTFGSVIAGLTTVSITVISGGSELRNAIKNSPFYPLLVGYVAELLYSAITLACFALLGMFVMLFPVNCEVVLTIAGAWLGFAAWSVFCVIRVVPLLMRLIKIR